MLFARAGFAGFAMGVVLSLAPAAMAEVRTVEVVGQAADSGLGKDVTRRRALEDALTEAAIKGGADINGYTAISEGVLVSDQLVLRPSSHILDYTVLSETTRNGFYQVKLRAAVGELPPPARCSRRARLDVSLYAPALDVGLKAPAWVAHLQPDLEKQFEQALAARSEVSVSRASESAMPGRSAQVGHEMDYTALTRGVSASSTPVGQLGFRASVRFEMVAGKLLQMNVTSRLIDSRSMKTVAQDSLRQEIRLGTKLPIRALDVLKTPDRQEIVRQFGDGIAAHIDRLIESYACRALAGALRYGDGKLTLPFGKDDGLTKLHLAYSEGRDTPYILFDIVRLDAHSVQLAPLDRRRSAKSLAGTHVRFMELGK